MIPSIGRSRNGGCRGRKKLVFAVGQEQGRNKEALWGLGCVYTTILLSKLRIVHLKGELSLFVSYTSKIKKYVKKM